MYKKYFEALNLTESASLKEVKDAYKKLIDKYNEELKNDEDNFDNINKKILDVNSAYDYLINNVFNDSSNNPYSLDRVRSLIDSNNLDEAREILLRAENRNAEWNYLMGKICHKEGWYDKSKNHFEVAYNLEPNNFEYSQAYNSFNNTNNEFRRTYTKRTQLDGAGCSGGCCDTCCTLFCIDSCCECCGCDFISCI